MTGLVLIVQHIKEFLTMFGVIILTQIVNMEFIQTNKKSELLVFEGYGYIRHRQLTDGASSWRCCITKCNGRVRLRNDQIEVITAHSHLPDPADIEKRKFRSALKDRAAMADETPRQTIFAAQKDINRETAANIPAYHSNQRTVNRTRQQNRPQMSEPSSLRGFEIPELLQMAHSGEKFMYYDSVKDVITAFEKLQSTCPEDCQPIFNYFEDNYIGRYNSTGQRQKPRFAIERWNCCERIKKGYARTNNSVEGWNSNFVKLVNTKHPSLPKLIEKFKDEQKNAEIMVEKITAGQQVKRPKKANYAKIDANLQELVHKYQHQNMIDFLRGCSYNIKL